ncbi:sigma-70 family RNA polymerase sigma factor [Terrisporobacter sp.]|uniref:sigma-70 family RNA polymerase sigma factor n=1 Tax=Terrisporobacter sp. TaxID=1965305 RepID=UPI003994250F
MIGGVIMGNDEYMKLFEQFKPMIIKLCNKWSRISVIEFDELMQISLLALMEAYKTYDKKRGMKFSTYVYNTIEYRIRKEIYIVDKKNKNKPTISLNTVIENGEGDTIELIDLIADDLDLEEEIQNKIMINYYEKECRRVLPEDKFQVCYLKWFKGCSNAYIAEVTHRKYIHDVLLNSRSLILAKSRTLKEEYHKLHNIDDYSHTERLALLDS